MQSQNLQKLLKTIERNDKGQFVPNNNQLKELVRYDEVNLGEIDTSQITSFRELFKNSARRDFSGIDSWDTSKVSTFMSCFEGAEHFNENINAWNVSNATNFMQMFYGAKSFNQPLDKWRTAKATNTIRMFFMAVEFNQNIQSWDMSNVIWAWEMFAGAQEFNQPLNDWDMSSVTKMQSMFLRAKAFNQPLDSWDISNVVDMQGLFSGAESFNQDLSAWGTKLGKVKNMFRAFANTKGLTIDFLGAWKIPENCNTDNITKGSALETNTKSTKSTKIAESKLANFIISELDSSVICGVICKIEWENDDFLGAWLPQNIKEQFKVYLAKYDDSENLTKANKDSWEFAFCEVLGYCFLIEKMSENGGGISDENIAKNREFSIYQGRKIKDFDDFDDSKSECVYNKNDLEIYFAPQDIWIINTAKFKNSESILSIVNAFVLLKAYKAKMRKLDESAKNYKNAKDLQDSHENLCKFDLHSYQNTPIAQNELESTLLLEVWRKMSEFYMVANIHDELKETIFQISQLVSNQKQDKLNNIMRWVAILSAIAALLAAVPVVQNLLK